jgi:predicted AAA+ superfamily ATPase
MMIPRRLDPVVHRRLRQFPAVALLGPRQVGKTTLARALRGDPDGPAPDYLDLENPADLGKLEDAAGYLRSRRDRLVIIDEVQRAPGLFQVLRGVIDERVQAGDQAGHFLLLGSASIDLLRQSSETLAGRIAYLELCPFDVLEVGSDQESMLWTRGGFPRSFLADSHEQSAAWRQNFITTYLERDIPQLGPRIPAETLRRFWTMLAHSQGCPLNAAQLARSLAITGKTVANYLDLMVDLLLVRRLQPYHANVGKRLVKSPKTYVRDSGLVHSLLRLDTLDEVLSHPIAGMSWEGYVIETLLRAAPARTQSSYYRTAAGAEIDLLLELPGDRLWAIDIKRGLAPKIEKGFHNACEDLKPTKALLAYSGTDRYPKAGGIEAIGIRELASELAALA